MEPDWVSEFILKQENERGVSEAKNLLTKLKSRDSKLQKIVKNCKEDSFEPKRKRSKYSFGSHGEVRYR